MEAKEQLYIRCAAEGEDVNRLYIPGARWERPGVGRGLLREREQCQRIDSVSKVFAVVHGSRVSKISYKAIQMSRVSLLSICYLEFVRALW